MGMLAKAPWEWGINKGFSDLMTDFIAFGICSLKTEFITFGVCSQTI
jgi:hypothetical protein